MLAANLNVPEKELHKTGSSRHYGHLPLRGSRKINPDLSFEFFPPATEKGAAKLWQTIEQLKALNPRMVSVTYGADGSSRDNTHAIVKRLLDETNLTVAPHITCVGASKGELREMAQQYWQDGIRHVVALRGDKPKSGGLASSSEQYSYCSEFVEDLKKIADFDISVAAYPETHPEALSPAKDLENLKRKFDAGATRAITQFFFDNAHFLRFRDHCALFGIEGEIVPGVLPVENFTQVQRFATACGTDIPVWLQERFAGLEDDGQTRKLLAAAVAIEQVNDLRRHGVDQFHLYTLNRADISYAIGRSLGISGHKKVDVGVTR